MILNKFFAIYPQTKEIQTLKGTKIMEPIQQCSKEHLTQKINLMHHIMIRLK